MPLHERGKAWYIVAAVVLVAILAYSIATKAWTFTLVSILTSAVYFATHRKAPEEKEMKLYKTGYDFDGKFVPWTSCKGFWFLQHKGYTDLHIDRSDRRNGVHIQIGTLSQMKIREVLKGNVPELTDQHESILDIIIRICKI